MKGSLIKAISTDPDLPLHGDKLVELVSNAIGAGLLLMIVMTWASYYYPGKDDDGKPAKSDLADSIQLSANVFFLTLGMAGIMILVSNSVARAFAIGAAISMVRFRIKLGQEAMGAALLFGVLSGMACGVDQVQTAWLLVSCYSLGLICFLLIIGFIQRFQQKKILKSEMILTNEKSQNPV